MPENKNKQGYKMLKIVHCKLVRETSIKYQSPVNNPRMATEIFQEFIGSRDRECMAVMGLDASYSPTFISIAAVGSINRSHISLRELYKTAIIANSVAIIIAHNHPSGSTNLSTEDIRITKRIRDAGDLLDIDLLDHVVVTASEIYSIREARPELFRS